MKENVFKFCSFHTKGYEKVFLNRKPTRGELKTIERYLRNKGFPGCAGFLDLVDVAKIQL